MRYIKLPNFLVIWKLPNEIYQKKQACMSDFITQQQQQQKIRLFQPFRVEKLSSQAFGSNFMMMFLANLINFNIDYVGPEGTMLSIFFFVDNPALIYSVIFLICFEFILSSTKIIMMNRIENLYQGKKNE